MDIRVGLFIISTDHVYLNSIEIYWELFVEFSCDSYEILYIEFILVILLIFITSGCYNNPILSSLSLLLF